MSLSLTPSLAASSSACVRASIVTFSAAAIFAAFSMGTGEGAEELVEKMPNVGKQIIHEHEELAEKLALVLYTLGVISLLGLYTNFKNHIKSKLISYLALAIAAVGVFLAQQVGTSGGEVRHTEIRTNANINSVSNPENELDND